MTTDYFTKCAPHYLSRSQSGAWRWVRQREWNSIVQALEPKPGERLLDLGCGAGFYSIPLARDCGLSVLGVDNCRAMIDQMKLAGVPACHQDVESLDQLGSFDLILAAGLLEFVRQPQAVLVGCRKHLVRDGRLVLLVPTEGLSGWVYRQYHTLQGCHVYIRKRLEYRAMAEAIGFQFVRTYKSTPLSRVLVFRAP